MSPTLMMLGARILQRVFIVLLLLAGAFLLRGAVQFHDGVRLTRGDCATDMRHRGDLTTTAAYVRPCRAASESA